MTELPAALAPLAAYSQFLLYKLIWDEAKQKFQKIPINPHTLLSYEKRANWQQDPAATTDATTAITLAGALGDSYGVGFLFTTRDPFFFVDLDACLLADGSGWSPVAMDILGRLPGAAVEVSQSGRGLHIFGCGVSPEHAKKNEALGLEFYTESRFVALTGTNAIGNAGLDFSAHLPGLVAAYFTPKTTAKDQDWTSEPVEGWNGIEDDDALIARALESTNGAGVFGGKSNFAALWQGDEDALGKSYPADGDGAYNGSQADAALAQHLAFWTGNNCERIFTLMWRSGLVREKWEREDYLVRTITRAAALQTTFHATGETFPEGEAKAEQFGAPKLRGSSEAQIKYATSTRARILAGATDAEAAKLCSASGTNATARFWLDNQDRSPADLVAMLTPIEKAAEPLGKHLKAAEIVSGHQYLSATLQIEHFDGCVYVQDLHKIFTPEGAILKSEQFNATYGGYVFQLDETGDKTTRKAWDAFTESQVVRYPKAINTCFRPELQPGQIIQEEGRTLVNVYVPVSTPRVSGDPAPFLNHLSKLLPDPRDQQIILSYMAACVQHRGVKFQWAPLIQGAEGNGKTLFTRCVAFAVGTRYTHLPPATEISEKFNEWLFNKVFIGIEDVYVPDNKKEVIEVLKPMITNDRLAMRAMQQSQVMGDNRANFMLNSNHKDAIRKTRSDRRFAVFFTEQQNEQDIRRDGMDGDYFPDLYDWLRGQGRYSGLGDSYGYAVVNEFLSTFQIPYELNPAGACHRAPETSSTQAAIAASLGGVEQEIIEAVEEGRPGFAGGWISSMALDRLLQSLRRGGAIPRNRRREVLQSLGFDYHPSLHEGRTSRHITVDGGKPRLFIRDGHVSANLKTPVEIMKAYEEAQSASIAGEVAAAGEVFKRG